VSKKRLKKIHVMLGVARRILAVRVSRRSPDPARLASEPRLTMPVQMLATVVGCGLGVAAVSRMAAMLPPPGARTCIALPMGGGAYELDLDARDVAFYCTAVPICAMSNAHWLAIGVVAACAGVRIFPDDKAD